MLSEIAGALFRACCVAAFVAAPSLLLPSVAAGSAQIAVVIAILAAILVFMEYYGRYPSIVEFRFAPPFNRTRFIAAAVVVLSLSMIERGKTDPSSLTIVLNHFAGLLGEVADFPYSPVRLMLLALPSGADPTLIADLRTAAGLSYIASLALIAAFIFFVRLRNWPMRGAPFNVWVNLPLFDPTRGGDVVERLRRDGGVNAVLGILLPFMIPTLVKLVPGLMDPALLTDSQALIWTTVAWSILPASMLIRGVALLRVAELIEARRKVLGGASAGAEALQGG